MRLRKPLKEEAEICATGNGSGATRLASTHKANGGFRGFVATSITTLSLDFVVCGYSEPSPVSEALADYLGSSMNLS